MARYREPKCAAPDIEDSRTGVCGVRMIALGERHPSFGPNWRPGMWVFLCPRCGAVRAIDDEKTHHYLERTRA